MKNWGNGNTLLLINLNNLIYKDIFYNSCGSLEQNKRIVWVQWKDKGVFCQERCGAKWWKMKHYTCDFFLHLQSALGNFEARVGSKVQGMAKKKNVEIDFIARDF